MEERRKGDARIYIVSTLFFACIISGGVFLCLYLILPSTQSSSWYPIAGLILVGIPWAFWFLAYIYRCFRPGEAQIQEGIVLKVANNHAVSPKAAVTTTLVDQERGRSPVHSPTGGRHVQFGVVTVMGSENDIGGGAQIDREAMARQAGILLQEEEDRGEESQSNTALNDVSVASRESERPLTLSASSL